ncbi:uncharacterized protein LOC105282599 [Ooceraea biroi]|uniref:uncharacterized protein LOC105282599 n=1 Tax=Ooceraea biroi TaxID=2015173 RepID=UPI000F093ED2|nr:uncharacterized protein LOC105282599 [Ooceraea biroi]
MAKMGTNSCTCEMVINLRSAKRPRSHVYVIAADNRWIVKSRIRDSGRQSVKLQKAVAMSGSFTRAAWLFLITLVTITYRSAGEPSQLIVCSQPNVFTVQITGNEQVVYGTKLLIRHSPQVGIFSYPEIKPVNVVFNESIIEFTGYTSFQRSAIQDLLPERLSWSASGIIFGIGTLQKLSSENYAVQECRLFLPSNIKASSNLPKVMEEAIIYYAQSCAKEYLCERIGTMTEKELQNINMYDEDRHNIQRIIHPTNSTRRVELIMNVPVDIVLKNVIHYIKENGLSIVELPDVKEVYDIGLGVKCVFEMVNGTFEDLSSLKRTENAFMSNEGRTNLVDAAFGLSTANFKYDYKLEAALIKVSGKILATVKELAMAAKVAIHYDKTCEVKLEYVKITELGKIDFKITGLGPFNYLTSTIFTWLTKTWQNRIVKIIEVNVRKIAEKQLNDYICNNYYNEITV